MGASAQWISPWGSGSPYPGMSRESSVGYGSPYSANNAGAAAAQATSYSNQPPAMYFHPNNPPPSGYYLPQNAVGGGAGRYSAGFSIDARDLAIGK